MATLHDHDDQGLGDLVAQLKVDARNYAQAEVDYVKALASVRLAEARTGLTLIVPAVLLAMTALTGLEVGLIFSLEPLVGPLGATAIVVGATLLLAIVLALVGWKSLSKAIGGSK